MVSTIPFLIISLICILPCSKTSALGGVPIGRRNARELDNVIPARNGSGGQLFNAAMLATTGMNIAAVAVFDIVLPIIIVIETIRITITGKGRILNADNLVPR